MNPDSLPHGIHKPGAVPFKEAADTKTLGKIANGISGLLIVLLVIPAVIRCYKYLSGWQLFAGCMGSLLILFPHELLHAICFKEDVNLYTNLAQGMLFVVGTETMSKSRFVFMSLMPNIVFGFIPYIAGLLRPQSVFLVVLGILAIGMGAGDYYNVFNAIRQMPKGARTYMYKFNSYWYMP